MTLTAVYADDYSRVRLAATELAANIKFVTFDRSGDSIHWFVVRGGSKLSTTLSESAPLNSNTGFETDTSGWFASGGTLTRSTAQAHSGGASGRLVPDGTTATVVGGVTASTAPSVTVGADYTWTVWVNSLNSGVQPYVPAIAWLDSADAIISTDTGASVTPDQGVWTQLTMTATAPEGAVKASPRVHITGTPSSNLDPYIDDAELTTPFASAKLDDYEFTADVQNTYRAAYYDADEVLVSQETVAVTPLLDSVWLKSVARPFLNLKLPKCGVADGQIGRRGRGGVFDVIGRIRPVAVSDVRSGIEFTLRGATATFAKAQALDYLLMSGDILFVQAPAASRVPTIHAFCGDSSRQLKGPRVSEISAWLMPMTEVARPGAFIIGVLATYRTLLNRYATYSDVLAAHDTYASLLDLVADPSEVDFAGGALSSPLVEAGFGVGAYGESPYGK